MKKVIIFFFIFFIIICSTLPFFLLVPVFYPKKFEKEVLECSKEFHLTPSLVFAIIKTESGFNPNAKSKAGAIGLMQVMPETAKWIMGKEVNLFEPKTNIYVGCKYLGFLQSEFLDLPTTLSAYNAGPNKTKVWLEDERYSTASRTMRKTPYKETNNYIKKVLSSQKIYKFLYKI